MQRGVTVEEVQLATRLAKEHGIEVGMFLMWGYDGETIDDIEATVEHVKTSDPDLFFTTVSYPIKGTGYYDKVSKKIVLDLPWEKATDRDFAVKGRHSRDYYRFADQWLRNAVTAKRLEADDPEGAVRHAAAAAEARASLVAASADVEA
jgi:anaerobic magnesium-protoporphyrin IX monomethyl ester cyclase